MQPGQIEQPGQPEQSGQTDVKPSLEERVSSLVDTYKRTKAIPDDIDEVTAFAVKAEARRRETQASFTKRQQELKALKEENDKLTLRFEDSVDLSGLPISEQAEMAELKNQDPDSWYRKLKDIEKREQDKRRTEREEIRQEAEKNAALSVRQEQLAAFNAANPDIRLSDDIIRNDIPPRLVKQLESGEIEFDVWLDKVRQFITTPKTVKSVDAPAVEPAFSTSRSVNAHNLPEGQPDLSEYKEAIY